MYIGVNYSLVKVTAAPFHQNIKEKLHNGPIRGLRAGRL